MSETPTTTTSQKSIAIRLPICIAIRPPPPPICIALLSVPLSSQEREILQYSPHLYSSTRPICIAVRLPFVSQYAPHLYRNTFGKILVVVVTGMFSNYSTKSPRQDFAHRVAHLLINTLSMSPQVHTLLNEVAGVFLAEVLWQHPFNPWVIKLLGRLGY